MKISKTSTFIKSATLIVLLSSCGGGGNTTNSVTTITPEDITRPDSPVFMNSLGVIPLIQNIDSSFQLKLNNIGAESYQIDSITVSNGNDTRDLNNIINVEKSECSNGLMANGSCNLKISPLIKHSAAAVLKVTMHGANGKSKVLTQLLRMSDKLSGNDFVFSSELGEINNTLGYYGISIPVILMKDYNKLAPLNGELDCNGNYSKGSSCTLVLGGKLTSTNNRELAIGLNGYDEDGEIIGSKQEVVVVNGGEQISRAELQLSQSAVHLGAGDKEITRLTLFNKGNLAATNVLTSVTSKEIALKQNCAETIAVGASCMIELSSDSETNGNGVLAVNYKSENNSYSIGTDISYSATNPTLEMAIVADKELELMNTLTSTTAKQKVTFINKGNRDIRNLDFKIVNTSELKSGKEDLVISQNIENGCLKETLLAKKGGLCAIELIYSPMNDQAHLKSLAINSQYLDSQGKLVTHKDAWQIKHSAISTENTDFLEIKQLDLESMNLHVSTSETEKTVTYQLKNISDLPTRYSIQLNGMPTITGIPASANNRLTILPAATVEDCLDNIILASGKSCYFKLKYISSTTNEQINNLSLNTNYIIKDAVKELNKSLTSAHFFVKTEQVPTDDSLIYTFKRDGSAIKVSGFDPHTDLPVMESTYSFRSLIHKECVKNVEGAVGFAVDPKKKFIYLSCNADGPIRYILQIDTKNKNEMLRKIGEMRPVDKNAVFTNHLAFLGNTAYSVESLPDVATNHFKIYTVNEANGQFTETEQSKNNILEFDFNIKKGPSRVSSIFIHPDGTFLYFSHTVTKKLYIYKIDKDTHNLTETTGYLNGRQVDVLDIIWVQNENNNKHTPYLIDTTTREGEVDEYVINPEDGRWSRGDTKIKIPGLSVFRGCNLVSKMLYCIAWDATAPSGQYDGLGIYLINFKTFDHFEQLFTWNSTLSSKFETYMEASPSKKFLYLTRRGKLDTIYIINEDLTLSEYKPNINH